MSGVAAVLDNAGEYYLQDMLERITHRGFRKDILFNNASIKLGEVSFYEEDYNNLHYRGCGIALDGTPLFNNKKISKRELVNLYLEHGTDLLDKLEGQFAFILSDGEDLLAVRDTFGVKPLYYGITEKGTFFASELKAMTNICHNTDYFPPGYYFTRNRGFQQYKELPRIDPELINLEEAELRIKEVMFSAVKRALDTRYKIGIFLSGGVDSSIITAVACDVLGPSNVYTYSAGVENSPDIQNARKMAQFAGTHHSEYLYSREQMYEVLPQVIYYLESFDVEMINSSIANYFVSQLAKSEGVNVILSGEGADELFGGYHFLKQFKSDELKFIHELQQLLQGMHNGGFQRVDRMAKAHSLDVEMPFMYENVVKLALSIPSRWKVTEDEMGKWILRKAFTDYVPEEIIWRRKAQFGVGTGTENVMQKFIDNEIPDEEYHRANEGEENIEFKSKEEYYYYKIFKKYYPGRAALKTVNRWLV